MTRLTGKNGVRLLFMVALLTLLFSTACWAKVYDSSYRDTAAARERMYSEKAADGPRARLSSSERHEARVAPYDGDQGIRVRASGTATGTPDLAIVSLGVESVSETASSARNEAAEAMASVMLVLDEAGVEERDVQTQYFNISPRYQSVQVTHCDDDAETEETAVSGDENCNTFWEQRLVGYAVSNQLSVRIRDLDNVGSIIDQVTEAAGDLVRVNGISFTIEDSGTLQDEARENAVDEMQRKAEVIAQLAGVGLGRLVSLREESYSVEPQPVYARAAVALESAADTSISAGELAVSVSVTGVYLITENPAH